MKILNIKSIGVCVSKINFDSESKKSTITEKSGKLALMITQGDKKAQTEFIQLNYKWLLIIIRRKFSHSNNHEDIVQDAFLLAITKLKKDEINNPKAILGFLRTAALNIGFSYLREDKKFQSSVEQDLIEKIQNNTQDVLSKLIWKDKSNYVKQVISELKVQRDKDILNKFYFQDQGKPAICQELKLSNEHFDRVLYRAKQRLKQIIDFKGSNKPDNNIRTIKSKPSPTSNNTMLRIINGFSKMFKKYFKHNIGAKA